jgi:YegS/Rv2252/BmrU family lipid kinase
MKTVFIVNNKNNRLAKLLPRLEGLSRHPGLGGVQLVSTLWRQHAVELARNATKNGCDALIAVGGDGTLHEVVNGVLQSNIPANAFPAIGLLPYGSANDFARTAGISRSLEALVALIESRSTQRIDLGKIVLEQTGETRYFINIAGLGLSPEVARKVAETSSVLGPGFNYFRQILSGFSGYEKKEVRCTGGSWQWTGRLLQMAVANGRFFGNAVCIAPDARLADGQFQVAIFGDLSVWDYIKNLGNLKKGAKIKHAQVHYYPSANLQIKSSEPCGIEADGEYVGLVPATFSIMPKVIRFLRPADKE